MKMEQKDSPLLKSNYGASFSVGKTFFVHKKPIVNMIYFGIDATWFDMTYTNYKIQDIDDGYIDIYSDHQIEIGMQVGPSITITPISNLNKFKIHGYFHYAPSFSGLYMDDSFYGNYATFFTGGASVSFGVIGVGIEARFGNCKYKSFSDDGEEETLANSKINHKGFRTYISFRF